MRAEVECQCQRLGGCSGCELVKDGADIIESEVDALFDALRGVASEEEDAARAHLDEKRQLSVRQVLHLVDIDLVELAQYLKLVSLLLRCQYQGTVDCKDKVAIVPEALAVVLRLAFVA